MIHSTYVHIHETKKNNLFFSLSHQNVDQVNILYRKTSTENSNDDSSTSMLSAEMCERSFNSTVKNYTSSKQEQRSKWKRIEFLFRQMSKFYMVYLCHSRFFFSRDKNHVTKLLSRFPNLDRKLLKREYPHVNIQQLEFNDRTRGHFAPKFD